MRSLPPKLLRRYQDLLNASQIDRRQQAGYLKWFRYYYDFCLKYSLAGTNPETSASFLDKLGSKEQTEDQIRQADKAVSLYRQLAANMSTTEVNVPPSGTRKNESFQETLQDCPESDQGKTIDTKTIPREVAQPEISRQNAFTQDIAKSNTDASPDIATGTDWTQLYDDLASSIQVRHYSPKTLRSYRSWIRKFQTFVKSKDPSFITVEDVKNYLTWLAVERHISASSQNLAFNSLLYLFRNVLGKEFGTIDGVVRAKKRPYIPVVLERAEVDRVIAEMAHPYSLVVKLLYGCGLRLFECLQLRIQCFNFGAGVLTIHDGKGKKDRTVPIPEILAAELQEQIVRVGELHQQDLELGYDGVFLFDALGLKYKTLNP